MRSSFAGPGVLSLDYLDMLLMSGEMRWLGLVLTLATGNNEFLCERAQHFTTEFSHVVSQCLYISSWYL